MRVHVLHSCLVAAVLAASMIAGGLHAQAIPRSKADVGVVVAWFENRTGDSTLDPIGGAAATWVADALDGARIGRVVRSGDVRQLMTSGQARLTTGDLAARTGAGLLVRGSYTREGDQLVFTADLVDVAADVVLTTSGPIRGPADGTAAYDALYQDLATALDMRRLWGPASLYWPRPRLFVAWRTWQEANANYFSKGDMVGALPGYERAAAMDTSWILAKYGIWVTNGNLGRQAVMDSMEAVVRPTMTANSGPLHDVYDWLSAAHRGDHEAMYQAAKRLQPRDPVGEAYTVALPAVRTGRFEEVPQLYAMRDTSDSWVREWRAWDGFTLAALHILGRHEEELAVARENIGRRGLDWGTGTWEVTALAALGRAEDLDTALSRLQALTPVGNTTIAAPLGNAGWELLAHGNEKLGREMFRRRLDYLRSLPTSRQAQLGAAIANALLTTGEHRRAVTSYDSLSSAAPDNQTYLGYLGIAAVLAGDKAKAAAADAKLAAESRPTYRAGALYWQSVIAGQRGDCAEAVKLLREGLAAGLVMNDYGYHRWNAFGKARSCKELPALTGQRPSE